MYVASAEALTLTRFSDRGVWKYVLVKVPMSDIIQIIAAYKLSFETFNDMFLTSGNIIPFRQYRNIRELRIYKRADILKIILEEI